MRPYELIKKKRDGLALEDQEITSLIQRYTAGEVTDDQMAAMCMAIYFRGLSPRELAAWTFAMLRSGEVLDLSEIPGCKVDKHSTGGVGDKVSLALAPLCAACGVKVPMVSGRGLGHTGGTLDKLRSIPGFEVELPLAKYRELIGSVGTCLIGQLPTLAPADRKLYALRDVTATVDSLPLIASSIMSKKLAEGIDALVLDVKVGSGAFMKSPAEARALARCMVDLGRAMGKRVVALLTDMSQPLGRAVGNSLEVREALQILKGEGPGDATECTLLLSAKVLELAGVAASEETARRLLDEAITTGRALAKFEELVAAQGGEARAVREPDRYLPMARHIVPLRAWRAGYVRAIQTEEVGLAAVELGAGRARVDSAIDPAVGFVFEKRLGERVAEGEVLLKVHASGEESLARALARLRGAIELGAEPVAPPQLLLEVIE